MCVANWTGFAHPAMTHTTHMANGAKSSATRSQPPQRERIMTAKSNIDIIKDLEPKLVWELFANMSDVPRPSKKEEKIRTHIHEVCETNGLKSREDGVGNIVVEVPASPGFESAPIVVLQGHIDMVCEKNSGTEHDFDNEGIKFVLGTDQNGRQVLRANQTTLGADNGIGVAMGMAAALDPAVKHGPLELLLTIDEEMGMTGAAALTPDFFKGRCLINLDSEEDDAIYIGCAGGVDVTLKWNLPTTAPTSGVEIVKVTVSGLRGGHSGGDIHENRGNAIKALAATIVGCGIDGIQLATITGGSKRNAIPRESFAVVAGPAGSESILKNVAAKIQKSIKIKNLEPNPSITIEKLDHAQAASTASAQDTKRFLDTLLALPSGVIGMHPKMKKLVQTSNNLSTAFSTEEGNLKIEVGCLTRSSSEEWKCVVAEQLSAIGRLGGAEVVIGNAYPGWEPNPDSKMLAVAREAYRRLFNDDANVTAIHAGLECGIIGEKVPGVDTVSFGPTITGAHSPDELVYTDSVAKIWKMLVSVLKELAQNK